MSLAKSFQNTSIYDNKLYSVGSTLLKAPGKFDSETFQQCVVQLLQEDQYTPALKLLEVYHKSNKVSGISDFLLFESLYVYYKLNKDELFEKIDKSNLHDRGLQHLRAQQAYKLGDYSKSLKIYETLMNAPSSDGSDLLVNAKAIISQGKNSSLAEDDDEIIDTESYDLLFNIALIYQRRGEYSKALEYIERAQTLGESINKDESIKDIFLELAPMYLQKSFIYQLLKNNEKALQILYEFKERFSVVLNSENNESIQLFKIAFLNNYYTLFGKNNASILINKFNYGNTVDNLFKANKLLKSQYEIFKKNESLLNLQIDKNINNNNDITSLGLKCLQDSGAQIDQPKKFSRYLSKQLNEITDKVNEITKKKIISGGLLIGQLLINDENKHLDSQLNSTIIILEKIFNHSLLKTIVLKEYFIVVFLLINLYQLTYSNSKLQFKFQILYDKIYSYYSDIKELNESQSEFIKFVNFQCYQLCPKTNIEKISEMLSKIQDDSIVQIVLDDLENRPLNTDNLIPVDKLTEKLEFDELIDPTNFEKFLVGKSSQNNKITKPHKKRIRKVPQRIGKDAKDPERWYPLRDRSYYKMSKKDKKKLKESTQGGGADHTLEESGIISTSNPSSGNPSKSKKKKKGKK